MKKLYYSSAFSIVLNTIVGFIMFFAGGMYRITCGDMIPQKRHVLQVKILKFMCNEFGKSDALICMEFAVILCAIVLFFIWVDYIKKYADEH